MPLGPALINFETLAAGTNVTTQYAAQGVVFPDNPQIQTTSNARSPSRALRTMFGEFDTEPLRIQFTSSQSRVSFYAGREAAAVTGVLKAYDAAGTLVAQDGPRAVAGGAFTSKFQVAVASPTITRVTLEYAGVYGAVKYIDDLEIDGQAPPPLPTTAPLVHIDSPSNGQSLALPASVVVSGTAQGAAIVSGHLDVYRPRPPGASAPTTISFPIVLGGSGNARTFTSSVFMPVGDVTLTAFASNTANLIGSHAVGVSNLPVALRARVVAEGSAAGVGAFTFGGGGTAACSYAVYSQAAVASVNGTSFVVRGPILTKWLALIDTGAYPRLGCPVGEISQESSGSSQRFEHGRIYTSSLGTYYLSPEFGTIFDALGGVPALGVPLADPTAHASSETWELQRFRKPTESTLMATTLEIRGTPAKLLVERQGGNGALYGPPGAAASIEMNARTPTLVDTYACDSVTGPCPITAAAGAGQRFAAPGAWCGNTTFGTSELETYVSYGVALRPEWVSIDGQYHQTLFAGIVANSEASGADNPWGHETYDDPCPVANPLGIILSLYEFISTGRVCPSDWDMRVRPLPTYERMMVDYVDNVAIEVEKDFLNLGFFGGWSTPVPGDLVITSGRFIIDCGHNDPNWRTEIHPPSVLAVMSTGDYNQRPATFADLWVNGFYSGDPVELDVYPPPRPSADAQLIIARPAGNPGVDVTVVGATQDDTHLHIKVTASQRQVAVNPIGEMMMQSGRNYQGQWRVYWDNAPYVNQLQVLTRAADGSVWNRLLGTSGWSSWASLGGVATSAPSATVDKEGRIRVFVRGSDSAIWQKIYYRDAWSDWGSVGGSSTSAPSAAVDANGIISLFAQVGSSVRVTRYLNGLWNGWTTLSGVVSSAPTAAFSNVAFPNGGLFLAARGPMGEVLVRRKDAQETWTNWTSLGSSVASAPAIVAGAGGVWIFARRLDNTVWMATFINGSWSGWISLGGVALGAPSAAVDGTGGVYVVVPGPGGALSYRSLHGLAWSSWLPAGGDGTNGVGAVYR